MKDDYEDDLMPHSPLANGGGGLFNGVCVTATNYWTACELFRDGVAQWQPGEHEFPAGGTGDGHSFQAG